MFQKFCNLLIKDRDIGNVLYSFGALMTLVCLVGFATGDMPQLSKDWVAAIGCGVVLILFLARAWFGLLESYKEWKGRRKTKQGAI